MKNKKKFPILFMILLALSVLSCQTNPSKTPSSETDLELDDVSTSPEPNMTPSVSDATIPDVMIVLRDLAVHGCYELTATFNQKVAKTSGWIRSVEEVTYSSNASEEIMIVERWYRLDIEGFVVEGYGWAGTEEGNIQQEFVFLNGLYDDVFVNNWYNLESDFDEESGIQRTHSEVDSPLKFASDFCAIMAGSGTAGMSAVEYRGTPAIQFFFVFQTDALYSGDPQIKSLYFDRESNVLLGMDTYWVQPSGNMMLVEGTSYPVIEFNADPPEERFAEIWARVPHGEDFVPVEEGPGANSDPEVVANQCQALADAFNQKMTDTSGWVHGVNDRIYFNSVNGAYDPTYIEEFWRRFDSEGFILEGYNWNGTQEGEIQQEGIWLNGWYDEVYVNGGYNLEYDFDSKGEIQRPHSVIDAPIDFSDGFCTQLTDEESGNMAEVAFHGQAAWQFTYESVVPGGILIKAIYFSRDDGTLLGFNSNLVQPDDSVKLISEVVYRVFEFNADPPEDRFAEIWARVPHGEDFVPVEEGTP